MKFNLILPLIIFAVTNVFCQNNTAPIELHPSVGTSISALEKKKYKLFEFISDKGFTSAEIFAKPRVYSKPIVYYLKIVYYDTIIKNVNISGEEIEIQRRNVEVNKDNIIEEEIVVTDSIINLKKELKREKRELAKQKFKQRIKPRHKHHLDATYSINKLSLINIYSFILPTNSHTIPSQTYTSDNLLPQRKDISLNYSYQPIKYISAIIGLNISTFNTGSVNYELEETYLDYYNKTNYKSINGKTTFQIKSFQLGLLSGLKLNFINTKKINLYLKGTISTYFYNDISGKTSTIERITTTKNYYNNYNTTPYSTSTTIDIKNYQNFIKSEKKQYVFSFQNALGVEYNVIPNLSISIELLMKFTDPIIITETKNNYNFGYYIKNLAPNIGLNFNF